MQVRRNGARKTVSYVNTPNYRQCPHSRPMRCSCNGRLSLHLSVRMSVPSIDSSSVVQLVCCNQSADGRYQSIAAASAWTQSGQRRVVIRGQGLFNLYDYCVVLCLPHITYACEAHHSQQEAQLSPRDRAMRRVSWNFANCHATVQKLLVGYDKSWTNRSYEVGGLR